MEAAAAPAVRVDALELFVELLSRVETGGASDDFYGPLCEATCRVANMDRAVIFRYDEARRRVRAGGAYGIDPNLFADAHVTVESAPVVRRALMEDTVIEVTEADEREIPAEYRHLLRDATLVCTPISAGGRWSGVMLSDRARPPAAHRARARPAVDARQDRRAGDGRAHRDLPAGAGPPAPGAHRPRARGARERHPAAVRGVARALHRRGAAARGARALRGRAAGGALGAAAGAAAPARAHGAGEPHDAAAGDPAPPARAPRPRDRARARVGPRPRPARPGAARAVGARRGGAQRPQARPADAGRRAARPAEGAFVLEIVNDGVSGRDGSAGMGLRLAALEALQPGGIVEFGAREPDVWRVRLAVPLDRA